MEIRTGICGDAQEAGFMNATLQSTPDHQTEFSIATHVGFPDGTSKAKATNVLEELFIHLERSAKDYLERWPDTKDIKVGFEIEIGPFGNGEDE